MRKTRNFRPAVAETLEDRTVPSGVFNGPIGNIISGVSQFFHGDDDFGGASNQLSKSAQVVNQQIQSIYSAYHSAVNTLQKTNGTAGNTAAPTSASLTAFNTSIEAAVSAANQKITTALTANLPNTGAGLATTIQGDLTTLQNGLEQAAGKLTNTSSHSLFTLNQTAFGLFQTAQNQATKAVLSDTPPAGSTPITAKTVNQAVQTAFQTFNTAITADEQNVLNGTNKTLTASSDVTALGTSVLAALPSSLTSSKYDPTAAVNTAITNLQTTLGKIASPDTTSTISVRIFLHQVSQATSAAENQILRAIGPAIENYNNNLL